MEGLRAHIGSRLRVARRALRRLAAWRSAERDDRYRSPEEIALSNAADSLGVSIGEDYPRDADFAELPPGADAPDRVVAFREELLTYIGARKRRRRRRLVGIGAVLALIAYTALLAGALTGVFSDDDRGGGTPARAHFPDLPYPLSRGTGLAQDGSRVATTLPAEGGDVFVHSAYRDLNDDICLSTAQVARGVTRSADGGGCLPPSGIARAMDRVPAFVGGVSSADDHVLLRGLGRSDLERIVADDPRVRIDASISSPWRPGDSGAADDLVLRTFLVRLWMGPGVRIAGMPAMPARRDLGLTGIFSNGDEVPLANYGEALEGERPPTQMIDPIVEPVRYSDCVVLVPGEKLPAGKSRC